MIDREGHPTGDLAEEIIEGHEERGPQRFDRRKPSRRILLQGAGDDGSKGLRDLDVTGRIERRPVCVLRERLERRHALHRAFAGYHFEQHQAATIHVLKRRKRR
jgi:hypothetical protein